MQLPLIKNLRGLKLLVLVLVLSLMSGCVRDYPYSRTATEQSANVLYDWYNLIARIQLQTSPSLL